MKTKTLEIWVGSVTTAIRKTVLSTGGRNPPRFFKDSTMNNYEDYGDYPPSSLWWEKYDELEQQESHAVIKPFNGGKEEEDEV